MWLVLCLLVCGCDQVFGLQLPHEADARLQFFDAPGDAPFACPPIGSTPQFSALVHPVISQDCVEYTSSPSAALATAYCNGSAGGGSIGEGPVDHAMIAIPNLVATAATYLHPRLAPEGDQLFTERYGASGLAVAIFQRAGTAWTQASVVDHIGTAPVMGAFRFGTPTRGPARRMLVTDQAVGALIYELAFDGNAWQVDLTHDPVSELGVASVFQPPSLSPDGLRILFSVLNGEFHTMYSDRATIHDPFRTAVRLVGVPDILDGFLTEDCSRVYFSSVGTVFYVQQQ